MKNVLSRHDFVLGAIGNGLRKTYEGETTHNPTTGHGNTTATVLTKLVYIIDFAEQAGEARVPDMAFDPCG